MNRRPAQHLKDDNLFAVMSYLHTEFSHLGSMPFRHRPSIIVWMFYDFYLANVIKSIPSEYSSFRSIDVSHGMCQRGSCFRYMWSNPHIAFTLRNLTHLLGSKLPQSGSFDPHRIHIVNVGSDPLILCSHYTGKWFRCRVDPTSLHQKILLWSRPKLRSALWRVFTWHHSLVIVFEIRHFGFFSHIQSV